MVEQRPFKALVEGSSPSQPTPLKYSESGWIEGFGGGFWVGVRGSDPLEWARKRTSFVQQFVTFLIGLRTKRRLGPYHARNTNGVASYEERGGV